MSQALLLIAQAIALAHDRWRQRASKRGSHSGKIGTLDERIARLEAEAGLLRSRLQRVSSHRRPHYRRYERMDILWHAARYALSVEETARIFVISVQTVLNWRRVTNRKEPRLLPPLRGLPDLLHELVRRLKVEWPRMSTTAL